MIDLVTGVGLGARWRTAPLGDGYLLLAGWGGSI